MRMVKWIAGAGIAALALVVACEGPETRGAVESEAADGRFDDYGGAAGRSTADPQGLVTNPAAGAFFERGAADIRGRTENFFGEADRTDEYVIVERADGTRAAYGPDRIAALRAVVDGKPQGVALPLERTDVDGKIALNVGTVTVTQAYHNPYAGKIEAVYVFPLPQDAAVSDFVMVLGERRIRGIVREKEEARRIYETARAQGYNASLLSQERPNVFTQKVANIEPGQRIDVEITYFQTLAWRDGSFEMVVPTVVGPRFNPPGRTDGVGAVPFGQAGSSGQATEVSYLPPEKSSDHRIGIKVAIDAKLPLEKVECPSHPVTIEHDDGSRARVALRDGEDLPNRDFVLRYAVAREKLDGAVAVYRDPKSGDGWFTMLLQPPVEEVDAKPQPREMVFVVDCSGSMNGEPLSTCKRAIRRCLERLSPADTFQVVRFSDQASAMGAAPLAATPENVRNGLRYVDRLTTDGGTMMIRGVVAALSPRVEAGRRRIVTFMTDGYIGNERDILRAVHEHVGESRIFSFGVGSSTNRYLLERMAVLGRGVAAFIDVDDAGAEQIDALFARLEKPALANLTLDWGGADVTCVEPSRLPDLFSGRPLVVHGKVSGALPSQVRVRGQVGTVPQEFVLPVSEAREHPALRKLWARARIRSLNDALAYVATPQELVDEIRTLALEHGLASDYTSFVAVDASRITEGDHGTTIQVPVEMPKGVRYETAVTGTR